MQLSMFLYHSIILSGLSLFPFFVSCYIPVMYSALGLLLAMCLSTSPSIVFFNKLSRLDMCPIILPLLD